MKKSDRSGTADSQSLPSIPGPAKLIELTPAARNGLMAEHPPGIMVKSMIASGSQGRALIRVIRAVIGAFSFRNLS
ncbi:hypothetical protein [Pseudogemmobacter humi]|uniref:hypothetical protein n=1 Tax=Pseudogemmobacter humi TaxID=2483812 RepID=UPI000F51E94E|nr:hypothetical protein [Pseudogemmobacter humi]